MGFRAKCPLNWINFPIFIKSHFSFSAKSPLNRTPLIGPLTVCRFLERVLIQHMVMKNSLHSTYRAINALYMFHLNYFEKSQFFQKFLFLNLKSISLCAIIPLDSDSSNVRWNGCWRRAPIGHTLLGIFAQASARSVYNDDWSFLGHWYLCRSYSWWVLHFSFFQL